MYIDWARHRSGVRNTICSVQQNYNTKEKWETRVCIERFAMETTESAFRLSLAPGSEQGDQEHFWLNFHGRRKQTFRAREEGKGH